ncbi:MAG: DegT/DnrJ/EryC1/StrS aminotransferase family protein [Hahellaceae bacterium]|nr:DegT/DnrJ/EryC1/StrS aminotransferase family protein [Hahellaceae bacterium]
MQFFDVSAQYRELKTKIDKRIQNVLDHGQFIMGPEIFELEERLADFVGVKHAITCANGTDALLLSLLALGIKHGDAVFCPTFTFFASAEAICQAGGKVVFVDIDPLTFNISVEDLKIKIEAVKKEGLYVPKAIIAVDLFGLPADYPELLIVAKENSLMIVEDGAQGFGGSINRKHSCGFGDISTTSFFPSKPLGCYGDGGAIFTDCDANADLIRSLRMHGKGSDKYDNVRIGMNSRLDTLQAAILLEKLLIFPEELLRKSDIAKFYTDRLCELVEIPIVPNHMTSAWAQFTVRVTEPASVVSKLALMGVPTCIYYHKCLHEQKAFSHHSNYGSLINAERASREVMSLPIHPYLSEDDKGKIVNSLISVLG